MSITIGSACILRWPKAAGDGDSDAVPFPRPLLLLEDARTLIQKGKLCLQRFVPRKGFTSNSRYNFGTFEKPEFRWLSLYATPAKAVSVFPNLLCKQGAAGSSPATSTNYIFFNEVASMFSPLTTCYSGRGSRVRIA